MYHDAILSFTFSLLYSTLLLIKKNLITGIAQEIGDCIGKKERIVPLFRRLNELEKHLEPASATESGLSLGTIHILRKHFYSLTT